MTSKRQSVRLHPYLENRDEKGRFKKKCGAQGHINLDPETIAIYSLTARKKVTISQYQKLIDNNIVTSETAYICKHCVDRFAPRQLEAKNNKQYPDENEIEKADDEEITKFVELGKQLHDIVSADTKELFKKQGEIKKINTLLEYQPSDWVLNRPHALLHLINSLCGFDLNIASENKMTIVSKIIELIYYCHNSKLLLPNHFLENLLSYSFTNCKTFTNFMGNRSPGGSYSYIASWLNEQANNPISFPSGVVKVIFDNNQKIGRTYVITGTNIVPTSVITSQLWVTLDKRSLIQNEIICKPKNWMWTEKTVNNKENLITFFKTSSPVLRESRNSFILSCIKLVKDQIKKSGLDIFDNILEQELQAKSEKHCINCGCEGDSSFRLCRNCGGKLVKPEVDSFNGQMLDVQPYAAFEQFQSTCPDINCLTGEPDFLNPNSYQNIIQLLQNIGYRAGVKQYGGNREWLLIECDGLPYNIMREIIEKVWRCSNCNDCFFGSDSFNDHKCKVLYNTLPVREFDWIVPIMGLLHLEMNAARAFVKLNWNVFGKSAAYSLGFKSPKALEYLWKGSDHHKLWQFLEVLYQSISQELMVPYVKECAYKNDIPTVDGYWKWSETLENPNYIYLQHMALTYLHSLMTLRSGVRKCNANLVNCASSKLAHLFFARNHPIYQNIIYQNYLDLELMPDVLKSIREKYISASRTGKENKCQGGKNLLIYVILILPLKLISQDMTYKILI